jgi:hypothetical protein
MMPRPTTPTVPLRLAAPMLASPWDGLAQGAAQSAFDLADAAG